MYAQALVELAKNTTVSLSATGAHGGLAIFGCTALICCAAGYGAHEYLKYKTRLAELEFQKALSLLKNGADKQDNDDGNDDGPTPIAA